jgi:uridine phosphorylase
VLSSTLTPANGKVFVTTGNASVAIACLGAGASGVVTEVEHLVALGVRCFIAVGPAPAISMRVGRGDCVVVERALRDDGVSKHHLPPARYARADVALTERLAARARHCGLNTVHGASWTVPTPTGRRRPGSPPIEKRACSRPS